MTKEATKTKVCDRSSLFLSFFSLSLSGKVVTSFDELKKRRNFVVGSELTKHYEIIPIAAHKNFVISIN